MPKRANDPSILNTRVVIDACVLFPVWSCDVLLTAQQVGIIQAVIASPEIIEEARRNALEKFPDKADGIARRFEAVARFVEGGRERLPPTEFDDIQMINEKDRHVLRAAIHYAADFVITVDDGLHDELNNWSASRTGEEPLQGALTTDAFLNLVASQGPAKLAFLLRKMAGKRIHPPMTDLEVLGVLRERLPSLNKFELPRPR